MKTLLIIVLLAIAVGSCSSKPENHFWKGLVSQDDNFGISSSYKSKLMLVQTGSGVTGKGYYATPNDSTIYVLYSFEGEWDGDTLRLKETGIIEAAEIKGEWYTKDIRLYHPDGDEKKLMGSWRSHRNKNANGFSKYERVEKW